MSRSRVLRAFEKQRSGEEEKVGELLRTIAGRVLSGVAWLTEVCVRVCVRAPIREGIKQQEGGKKSNLDEKK